jgi:hypothetical protein
MGLLDGPAVGLRAGQRRKRECGEREASEQVAGDGAGDDLHREGFTTRKFADPQKSTALFSLPHWVRGEGPSVLASDSWKDDVCR